MTTPFAPGRHALHLCIDMQRLFAEETDWHTPSMAGILPNVLRISKAHAERTLFARFTVPDRAEAAPGAWRDYYRHWSRLTGAVLDPALIDLVEPLTAIAGPGRTFDKPTYSLFSNPAFSRRLEAEGVDTLVFTGVETDICVLATLFDAVDLGYRTAVVSDAVTSSSEASHRAVLDLLLPRMPQQVAILDTEALLAGWAEEARHGREAGVPVPPVPACGKPGEGSGL